MKYDVIISDTATANLLVAVVFGAPYHHRNEYTGHSAVLMNLVKFTRKVTEQVTSEMQDGQGTDKKIGNILN